jgi:hypothetical protein
VLRLPLLPTRQPLGHLPFPLELDGPDARCCAFFAVIV